MPDVGMPDSPRCDRKNRRTGHPARSPDRRPCHNVPEPEQPLFRHDQVQRDMVKRIITVRIDRGAVNTRAMGQVTVLLHRDRADHGQNQMVVADPDIVVTCAALAAVCPARLDA